MELICSRREHTIVYFVLCDHPDIKAIVYFDSDKPYPWWLDTTASSVAGFKDMANSPYMNVGPGGGSPPPSTTTTAPPDRIGDPLPRSVNVGTSRS